MQDFIAALAKRSSITCVTCERFGRVDLEFYSFDDAGEFTHQMYRLLVGELTWIAFNSEDTQTWRRHENIKRLNEILGEAPPCKIQPKELLPVEATESQHTEWRFRLNWEFESGAKAVDLFQRLLWILE